MSLEFSFLPTKIYLLSSLSSSATVLRVLAARAAFHTNVGNTMVRDDMKNKMLSRQWYILLLPQEYLLLPLGERLLLVVVEWKEEAK